MLKISIPKKYSLFHAANQISPAEQQTEASIKAATALKNRGVGRIGQDVGALVSANLIKAGAKTDDAVLFGVKMGRVVDMRLSMDGFVNPDTFQ
jgi:hypothetical protein